jgi:hypothetical protein
MVELEFVVAATVTLVAMSMAFKESWLSRITEHLALGVLGGYATVASIKYLIDTISTQVAGADYLNLIPSLFIGVLLYFQLSKEYRWVSNIPSSLLLGTMLGLLSTRTLRPQIIEQITATVFTFSGADALTSFNNIIILVTTILSLFFFFFSAGYSGTSGKLKQAARYLIMLSLGASFGNMYMGVVTRIIDRFMFLLGVY